MSQGRLPEDVFIARMARERKRRGWTMEQFAAEVGSASDGAVRLHQSAFTKLERENDRRNLRLDEAVFIAEALGLSVARMLSDDDLEDDLTQIRHLQERMAELQAELEQSDSRRRYVVEQLQATTREIARIVAGEDDDLFQKADAAVKRALSRKFVPTDEDTPIGPRSSMREVEVMGPVEAGIREDDAHKAAYKGRKSAGKDHKVTGTTSKAVKRRG